MTVSDRDRVLNRMVINHEVALPLEDAFAYINSIDFEMLVIKITTPDENIAKLWSREAALEAIQYYRNFLKIIRKYGEQYDYLPPSVEIDEIWHHHILDTKKYQEDCAKIFGTMLHHYPYFGMRGEEDHRNLDDAFEITQRLHTMEFGEAIMSFEMQAA